MNNLWDEYPNLKLNLAEVTKVMLKSVKCRQKPVEKSLIELINSGGKLLRPAFLLLSSEFGSERSNNLHSLAAAIEILHMATLIHDDVIDDSAIRRGKETVQSKHGKNFAVYLGDFLFCACFKILSQSSSLKTIDIDSNSMSKICIGEMEQYSSKYSLNVTVKQYLKRISAKTAELFSLSFYTGAIETKCNKLIIRTLSSIGHDIGMAFQIIDDILDYTGSENVVGKTIFNDIKQGIFTLPLIYALEKPKRELIETLSKKEYSDEDVQNIIKITEENGGVMMARNLAKRYTKKAFKKIATLPDIESKKILYKITYELLERNY